MRQHSVATPYMVGEVHFYLSEVGGKQCLFDCGPPTETGKACLESEVGLEGLANVFLTHCHIDHYGLAPWLEEKSRATIWIPRNDLVRLTRHEEHVAKAAELIDALGFGPAFLATMRRSFAQTTIFPKDYSRYRSVEDSPGFGDLGLEWVACPGHSQSDLAYIVGDEAVTGDILLRGIFQVPLLDLDLATFGGRFKNYEVWCDSISRIASLRGKLILPGHRKTADVDRALVEYVLTLLQRSRAVRPHRGLGLPAIVEEIFRGRLSDPFHVYLKASEIVFMLDFLEDPGRLARALESIGLFSELAEPFQECTVGR